MRYKYRYKNIKKGGSVTKKKETSEKGTKRKVTPKPVAPPTERELLENTAIQKAEGNFAAPLYPGVFVRRWHKVMISIKDKKEIIRPEEGTETLVIAVELSKVPDEQGALIEKVKKDDSIAGEVATQLWEKRKMYRFMYSIIVDENYAQRVIDKKK